MKRPRPAGQSEVKDKRLARRKAAPRIITPVAAALPAEPAAPGGSPSTPAEAAKGRGRFTDSEKLTINLGAVDLGSIDLLVAEGFFSNRSDLIRTAVRNLLADHRDIVNGALARQERTLGLRRITRVELETLRNEGQRIRISVVGLVVVDDDVPPQLAQDTIASLSVLGSLQVSPAVRAALSGRLD
jgi:Arc/MetJ-type ribon-helix-helix transcriptional regulator